MAIYTNLYLLVFLPAVLVIYGITPKRFRWAVLLAASYALYISFSQALVLVLMGTSLFTFLIGRRMGKIGDECAEALKSCKDRKQKNEIKKGFQKRRLLVLRLGVLVLLGILFYVNYYNFVAQNMNILLGKLGAQLPMARVLFPMGISFYTLEAIGYMADVYWERYPAEQHLGKMALFLSFFPQIMEGPIARYPDTADALFAGEPLRIENLNEGFLRIIWGLFKKMVVSDRLSYLITYIYGNYKEYHGSFIVLAAVGYTVQLYMEFSGSIDIVIGCGKLFGVTVPENFNQPFSAQSAAEFWRRWHMSLGNWFKNYVFYPITVSPLVKNWNKTARKKYGKYWAMVGTSAMALFPVWVATGVWHGAGWQYLFYGMYYFVILLLGVALEPLKEKRNAKLGISTDMWWFKWLRIFKTWIIIFVGELFFNAPSLKAGFHMFFSIFGDFHISSLWIYFPEAITAGDVVAIVVGSIIVWIVGFAKESGIDVRGKILGARLPAKWCVYYAIIFAILIFGAYGTGYQPVDLIYAGF
ncbi:MAG: MBOAT family O-acyltransferase [Eubacteriales bacterium]|nr:MBOAT family O-acyltransferase [Eubacteriales bacterium]